MGRPLAGLPACPTPCAPRLPPAPARSHSVVPGWKDILQLRAELGSITTIAAGKTYCSAQKQCIEPDDCMGGASPVYGCTECQPGGDRATCAACDDSRHLVLNGGANKCDCAAGYEWVDSQSACQGETGQAGADWQLGSNTRG